MGNLDRAWRLVSVSLIILNADTEILLFPVMSGISAVLVGVGFFVPLYRGGVFQSIHMGKGGLFLSSVRQRGNRILRFLGASLGLAWSLITYMIVPVILFEERGVYDSIYRSKEFFQGHWGEQVAGDFGVGLLAFVLSLPAFLLAAFLWGCDRGLAVIMAVCCFLVLSVVCSAVKGAFTVALYRYATPAGGAGGILGGHPR